MGEALFAQWEEIDLNEVLWTVPADRTKAGRVHRVPLSDRCLKVLKQARALAEDGSYIFPGRSAEKPLSNKVFQMMLSRMKLDVTAHEFRSSFCDWATAATSFLGRWPRWPLPIPSRTRSRPPIGAVTSRQSAAR